MSKTTPLPLLYWHTLRHIQPSQIAWRILRRLQRPLDRLAALLPGPAVPARFAPEPLRGLRALLEEAARSGLMPAPDALESIRKQEFRFLNLTAPPGKIPWHDRRLPRLWRYQLHGFRFLGAVAVANTVEPYLGDRDRALHWMRDWVKSNPAGAPDAWDAHPLADRLLHWAMAEAVFDLRDDALRASFARQARWLERHLEWDLRANHLLKNVCALAAAGCLLGDNALRAKGVRLMLEQFREQVLPDGGHCERSPMYHAFALWDGLVLLALLGDTPEAAELQDILSGMALFLDGVAHPDGDIPLFNDAALGEAPPARPLALLSLAWCGEQPSPATVSPAFAESGFYALDNPAGRMLLKAAPVPECQPGHAHGDPLSFELSIGQTRMLVDGGCHGYAESPLRGYCRSLSAHNTARVNGAEPMEAWSVFRVARRYTLEGVTRTLGEGGLVIDGAVRLPDGAVHRRTVRCLEEPTAWGLRDSAEAPGNGPVLLEVFFHAGPNAHVERRDDGLWVIHRGSVKLALMPAAGVRVTLSDGPEGENEFWHCPQFGRACPSPTLILQSEGEGTAECACWLFPPEHAWAVRLLRDGEDLDG